MKDVIVKNFDRWDKQVDSGSSFGPIRFSGEKLEVSDGFHSMDELYEHRHELFIALCRQLNAAGGYDVWRSKLHDDDTMYPGQFVLGIHIEKGKQISYHLPIERWEDTAFVQETRDKAPAWDKHSSQDVLKRLALL